MKLSDLKVGDKFRFLSQFDIGNCVLVGEGRTRGSDNRLEFAYWSENIGYKYTIAGESEVELITDPPTTGEFNRSADIEAETPITAGAIDLRCPKCNSPEPRLHPAVQYEGEAQICSDPYHKPEPQYRPYSDLRVLLGKSVRNTLSGCEYVVIAANEGYCKIDGKALYSDHMLEHYTYLDGTPCGEAC